MGEAVNVRIGTLLDALFEKEASDLIVKVGSPPALRLDGQLHALSSWEAMTAEQTHSLSDELLSPDHRAQLESGGTVDFSFEWKDQGRVRGNAFRQRGTIAIALRAIPTGIPTFSELRLPAITQKLVELPRGLILLTGPTGAGKSTTQASMIDWINGARAQHIITIEDPIEYVHADRNCLVEQREVGVDTTDFADALRAALREDPDVMLVGEMRDLESIRIALNIAETGHLVFATLHTNDTTQALNRIVDVFPGDQQQQIRVQLAASLQAVIYQQLLPLKAGGRVAAFEVLLGTPAVRALLRENKSAQLRNVVITSRSEGMQTLEHSMSELVAEGLVDWEEAVAVSLYPKEVERAQPGHRTRPAPPPSQPSSWRHPEPV
jgi:twitching motility protein PilT